MLLTYYIISSFAVTNNYFIYHSKLTWYERTVFIILTVYTYIGKNTNAFFKNVIFKITYYTFIKCKMYTHDNGIT